MKKVKCIYCDEYFSDSDNKFEDEYPVCPACDEKNKYYLGEALDQLMEYENQIFKKDQRLLNAIKSIKGEPYLKALGELIEGLDQTSDYSIVDKPKGNYQREYWHKEIQGVWVDQWRNGGYTGDDYAGDVYVKIKRKNKKDKYLRIPYSM